ncbi:tyrosine-protein phosphatase [Latilactobacillus graminis]|uniref:Protein-tyrosine phosphatase n=2 Tax=Latilactobacillus graminis TaxID=60519 RepID=A0AA89L1E8_9LACO|nr:tyrosine-protein phosphatase [Latilactobacillus graminis]KRM24324.1 protein-tyrosine phosphatase [Latilactobacillus graminis DSM 20719]QFP80121.1 tyrosine-protein phosphatase [Latilactobacillus graminis]
MREQQRVLDLTRSYNLRELGGYRTVDGQTVKWHKLLRSGSLNALTATDIENLLNYGVAYDVDFRSRHEIKVAPDPFDDSQLIYHRLSVFPFTDHDDTPKKPSKKGLIHLFSKKRPATPEQSSMERMYQQLVTDSHAQAAYRDLFTVLLNNHDTNGAVLYHCSAGKDRTGVATYLILSALGVGWDTILADYTLSNAVLGLDSTTPTRISSNDSQVAAMNAKRITPANLAIVRDTINQAYGNIDNYLTQVMALRPTEIKQLKTDYLE